MVLRGGAVIDRSIMNLKLVTSKICGFFLSVLVCAIPAKAEKFDLTMSHFMHAESGFSEVFVDPWIRALEWHSRGQVSVRVHGGESWLGNVAHQYDQVASGLVDIAIGHTSIPRGRFTCTHVTDVPFLIETAEQASEVLWALFPDYLQHEFDAVKLLALIAPEPGVLLTRDRPIVYPEDLKGLRIAASSPNIARMLQALGAETLILAPIDVHDHFASGDIDGLFLPWWGANAFQLTDVAQYVLELNSHTVPAFMVMNKETYARMPPDLQTAIDAIAGEALFEQTGGTWNVARNRETLRKEVNSMRDDFIAQGGHVTQLNSAQKELWVAATSGVVGQMEDELSEACGTDMVARARELSREHN